MTAAPAGAPAPRRRAPGPRIRVDVRLTDGTGFRRHLKEWQEAAAWLASPEFLGGARNIRSVHLGVRGEFPGGPR